jgi:hypothetical protein
MTATKRLSRRGFLTGLLARTPQPPARSPDRAEGKTAGKFFDTSDSGRCLLVAQYGSALSVHRAGHA